MVGAAARDVDRTRRAQVRADRARGSTVRAAHVARHLSETLLDRPLSVANTPFVEDSFRALAALLWAVEVHARMLPAGDRSDALRLAELIAAMLRDATEPAIDRVGRFVRDEMAMYASVCRTAHRVEPLAPGALERCRFTHVVAMIGPGIGIGDEIKVVRFLRQLADGLGIAARDVRVFSFCPPLWDTLAPEMQVAGLVEAPLAAFEALDAFVAGRPLFVSACFLRQDTLRVLAAGQPARDGVALTVSSGDVRVRFRDDATEYALRTLDPDVPNISHALFELGRQLAPAAGAARAEPAAFSALSWGTLRVLVNPFTSKHSPLRPSDWAEYLMTIRRASPPSKRLLCAVVPGLTPSCRAYADEIRAHALRRLPSDAVVELLDTGGPRALPANAIAQVYAALIDADVLLTIDTYAAHLAAQARVVSIALCLNRNVQFWDPAPHTFWLNLEAGQRTVSNAIRAVVSIAARDQQRGGPMAAAVAACGPLAAAGTPHEAGEADAPSRVLAWRSRADAVWDALPPPVARALTALDGDYAWPVQRDVLRAGEPRAARIAFERVAASQFFRLACLGAATQPTRGMLA